jgi:ABC-type multidrug transport system ATPase subunit
VKTYGPTVALRGVDVDIDCGALMLVEGANGSGKSTLIGILGGMIRPTAGAVNYEPFTDPAMARGVIGWVSHETLAYPDLSGKQNVELAARLHGIAPKEAWAVCSERFELGPFALRPMRTCSRGQRQRLALARALVHAPSLVLLDEPTTGLDRQGVLRLLAVVDAEVERGAAVVVVSHEPELFRERASASLTLERGRALKPAARAAS